MLIEPQFDTPESQALWTAEARIARMAAFEAALAEAQGEAGLIPNETAARVAQLIRAAKLDARAILEEARVAGSPVIPFVKALTAAVAKADSTVAPHVHYGSTTQDVVDTTAVMALADTAALIEDELAPAVDALIVLAQRHKATPMAARTVLQQATPISFGLKAALWAAGLERARADVTALKARDLAVQLGGAVGTLGIMGAKGPAVRAALAKRLKLVDPGLCWHTLRDPVLRCGTALTESCGAAAKVARDVLLMMQNEVGEASEQQSAERGGSSAMPHKHNPVDAMVPVAAHQTVSALLAGLAQAMAGEHERAPGTWHGEWVTLPALTVLSHAATRAIRNVVEGLTVDPGRMTENLGIHRGLLAAEALASALAPTLGKIEAQTLVRILSARVVAEHTHLKDLAAAEPAIAKALSADTRDGIFTHRAALAAAAAETERVLANVKANRKR